MNTQATTIPKRDKLESAIKNEIKSDLESWGWIVIFLIVSNKDGHPDVLACHNNGLCVFIETKTKTGRVTPIQQFRHEQLRAKGFEVIVARSREDVAHLQHVSSMQHAPRIPGF